MFIKQAKPGAGDGVMKMDHVSGKKQLAVASLISIGVALKGDVSGEAELHVDGTITGDIAVTRLMIGERGTVEGAIAADTVDIRGWVVGSIKAKQVHLYATATVSGDITQDQLTIDAGATFEGRSLKIQSAAVHVLADAV